MWVLNFYIVVFCNNEINTIDEKENINSSNEEKKIIDAVISEKEGSLD